MGAMLQMFAGVVLVLCWCFAGAMLVLCWCCAGVAGAVLMLAGAVLVLLVLC